MKDIFEILNDADIALDDLDGEKLTKQEQEQIFHLITAKDKKENWMKKNMKKMLASAAVLSLVIVTAAFGSKLMAVASNILAYFTENTKTDYAEEVHENVEQDMGTMELMSVSREGRKIYLRVKFNFTEDITELADLCRGQEAVGGYMISKDGRLMLMDGTLLSENCTLNEKGELVIDGMVVKMKELVEKFDIPEEKLSTTDYNAPQCYVLDAAPFQNSNIIINGVDVDEWMESSYVITELEKGNFPIEFISARNIEISEDTLIQDIELSLLDADYAEDIDISFRYKDIELSERTLRGEWSLDYTISNAKYDDVELKRMPIELSATGINGISYRLESYSVTPGGIKLYGYDGWNVYYEEHKDDPSGTSGINATVRLTAYDDLGNKYLLYPVDDNPGDSYNTACTYSIYSGPADFNDEYLDRLDSNAKTLTIAYEEQRLPYDEDNRFTGEEELVLISEELTLEISRVE